MDLDYKNCSNDMENLEKIIIRDNQSYLFAPDTIKDQEYYNSNIHRRIDHFEKTCESLIKEESIASNIEELVKISIDTKLEVFSSIFIEKGLTSFLISLLQSEFNRNIISLDVIDAIYNCSYYSTNIMIDFMENQILSELIGHFEMFKGEIKSRVIKIISNFISEYQIKGFGMYFETLIQICGREIFETPDLDVCDHEAMHLLEMLAIRDDIISDIDEKHILFEIFGQVFNHEKVWLYKGALLGIYYLAQTQSGCEIILNDNERAKKAVLSGLAIGSEDIEYNSLLVLNCLYKIFEGDILMDLHQRIPLQKISLFLTSDDIDIQKATLNIFKTIVSRHPYLIQSLLLFGFYESCRGGLLYIFKNCSFEVKRSASYIVMETIRCSNESIIDYLIEKELVCYATETLTSDSNFIKDDSNPKTPLIIDSILYLLEIDVFKKRLIAQLIDWGIYEMIYNFETTNIDIDNKFTILKGILEEEMNI